MDPNSGPGCWYLSFATRYHVCVLIRPHSYTSWGKLVRFKGILTVGLSTTPQQLFSVILCSQNATLRAEPGNRGRRYIVSVRGQTRRSLEGEMQLSLTCREGRRPPLPVASTPSQSVHPDRTFGSVSVLIQRLWRMNQSASRTTTSADKPVFFIWVSDWRRATLFSTCWFCLNKSGPRGRAAAFHW